MDLQKIVYLNGNVYVAKLVTSEFGAYDKALFTKYAEPTVQIGGTFVDGTTTFTLTTDTKQIMTQSPIIQQFSAITIGDYVEAGKRANVYVNVMETRIREAMTNLRTLDSTTNLETNKTVVI